MWTIAKAPPISFRIHEATPTTISYNVSTRRHTSNRTGTILRYTGVALRIILGSYCFVICCILMQCLLYPHNFVATHRVMANSSVLKSAWTIVYKIPLQYLLVTLIICFWLVIRRGYKEETLLVLRGLGVQTSTSGPTYLSTASTRFIPASQIQDMWIHEAFIGFEVRFYLAIIVEEEQDLVVVFPELLPKRYILEEVWRGAKACLHGSKS